MKNGIRKDRRIRYHNIITWDICSLNINYNFSRNGRSGKRTQRGAAAPLRSLRETYVLANCMLLLKILS